MPLPAKPITLSPESIQRVNDFKARHQTLYSMDEAVAITGKAAYTLRRYIKLGVLECTKVHGRIKFTEKQLEDFMMPNG